MGNLHRGHLSLVREAHRRCDRVVCSIFVNPMQFGANEDFNHYPRTLEHDAELLQAENCDLIYLPSADELYPEGLDNITHIEVTNITDILEGEQRPGHFTGVSTIVLKLFNLVKPDIAVFGNKDYQQLLVVSKMVEDLNLDVKIIGFETGRESSGLAISSRNQYLNPQQFELAALIQQALQQTAVLISAGDRNYPKLEANATLKLSEAGFTVDYFTIRHAQSLKSANADDKNLVILVTARLGTTRLLDNIELRL